MRRPDLRVSIGQAAHRTIECTWLSLREPLLAKYVDEGTYRFVSSAYSLTITLAYGRVCAGKRLESHRGPYEHAYREPQRDGCRHELQPCSAARIARWAASVPITRGTTARNSPSSTTLQTCDHSPRRAFRISCLQCAFRSGAGGIVTSSGSDREHSRPANTQVQAISDRTI